MGSEIIKNQKITGPISGFNEIRTVSRTPLIELKSALDTISNLRNVTTTAGSGAIAISNSEYLLSTTALASDLACFDSAERGRYLPGYEATAGIGIRTPVGGPALTGQMERRWGYYDTNDGYFFGEDATGLFVAYRRAGVDTKIYQATGGTQWNGDKLDGAGPSGLTLDTDEGVIFQVNYSWYGYGLIIFEAVMQDVNAAVKQRPIPVHYLKVLNQTSIEQPNLPLRAEVINGTTATAHSMYVAGRQYTISGQYKPNYRLTGEIAGDGGVISTSTTPVPIISFKRKSGSKFLAQSVKFAEFEILGTTAPHFIGFVLNGSLTGSSFGIPTGHTDAETVCESDKAATAISGGIQVGGWHLVDATNKGRIALAQTGFDLDFIEDQPITMVARTVTGSDSITAATLNVKEEW
jgi:hypothetical protein